MIHEKNNDFDFIPVFKLSRFGRNAADVRNSLQYIQDYGVNLICVEDGIDSSKDSGKLTITVLSAVAEIERENILVQTMEGRKQKAREGKWNGGQAPFGYTLDTKNSTLIVDHEEAEIVRLIFDKFVHTEMGADTICDYLNQHGYTKKRVRDQKVIHFTRSFLMRVLDNPVYERMTDLEKKQFMRTFIESIELYTEKKDNGRIISKIELRFPVYYDGQEGNEIHMPDKNTVETVCLLTHKG